MTATFIGAVALLAVMVYLIIRPFLSSSAQTTAPAVESLPVAAEPVKESVSVAAAPAAAVSAPTEDELRAKVEAAIAARKAELATPAPTCGGCGATVSTDDAFCRSCGAKQD